MEVGKVTKSGEDLWKKTKICFGSTKMRIFYQKKHFTPGKKSGKMTLPPQKNIPVMPLNTYLMTCFKQWFLVILPNMSVPEVDGWLLLYVIAFNISLRHGSQIRPQLSAASPTNRPQPKVIITIVIIKLKLWPAAGCEAKVAAKLSSSP